MLNTTEVRIENSTKCNHKCVFCPLNNGKFKREKTIMSDSLYLYLLAKITKEQNNFDTLTISAMGEPFMDNSIYNKIQIAHDFGFKNIHVLTNGSLINDKELIRILDKNILSSIRVSLHAINDDKHKEITGVSDLLNILDTIKLINSHKRNTKLILTTVVNNANKNHYPEIIHEFDDKCDLLEIWHAHNWTNTFHFRNNQIISKTCGRPFNGPLQVQVDGTVNMCCFDYNGEILLGDLKKNSLHDIFNNREFNNLKYYHENGRLEDTDYVCKNCDQRMNKENSLIYTNKSQDNRTNLTSTSFSNLMEA